MSHGIRRRRSQVHQGIHDTEHAGSGDSITPHYTAGSDRNSPETTSRGVGPETRALEAFGYRRIGTEYLLVREPQNQHDSSAVAVYGRGRKLGFISASKAASFAPLLDNHRADVFLDF